MRKSSPTPPLLQRYFYPRHSLSLSSSLLERLLIVLLLKFNTILKGVCLSFAPGRSRERRRVYLLPKSNRAEREWCASATPCLLWPPLLLLPPAHSRGDNRRCLHRPPTRASRLQSRPLQRRRSPSPPCRRVDRSRWASYDAEASSTASSHRCCRH